MMAKKITIEQMGRILDMAGIDASVDEIIIDAKDDATRYVDNTMEELAGVRQKIATLKAAEAVALTEAKQAKKDKALVDSL